jgi:hypothetical protein
VGVGAAVAAVHAAAARLQHSHGTPQSALTPAISNK